MKLSTDYLEEALVTMGDISDTKKAELLKLNKQDLHRFRSGEQVMNDFACIVVAQRLGIDPLIIITQANSEREKNPKRKEFWEDFKRQLGVKLGVTGLAGAMILAMMGTPTPAKANYLSEPEKGNMQFTLCQISMSSSMDESGCAGSHRQSWLWSRT